MIESNLTERLAKVEADLEKATVAAKLASARRARLSAERRALKAELENMELRHVNELLRAELAEIEAAEQLTQHPTQNAAKTAPEPAMPHPLQVNDKPRSAAAPPPDGQHVVDPTEQSPRPAARGAPRPIL